MHPAIANRPSPVLLRLLVVFFERRQQARRHTKRLAMIVERKITHVQREGAPVAFLLDDNGDGAALDDQAR